MRMTWQPYRALYVHVPFCKQRCAYCDFATQAVQRDDARLDEYVDTMTRTIRRLSRQDVLGDIQTVYFGGGTPSYLGNKRLASLLYTLSLSMHLLPETECTLEANPESLTLPMVKDLFALGVTRLSLGIQSFDDEVLRILGRVHSAHDAFRAIDIAQTRFDNVSIDLMCGLPGQSRESFVRDLMHALSLGVQHISIYPLTIEDNTPFAARLAAGTLHYDEDAGADLMEEAAELLEAAGMYRYEVASYAYPGYESRHNTAYWTGVPYLGLGPGAVSMRQDDFTRERLQDTQVIDVLDVFQYTAEDLMLGMRMSQGVSDEKLEEACLLLPDARHVFTDLMHEGYVIYDGQRWKPTTKGWLFGNHLYGALLDLAP